MVTFQKSKCESICKEEKESKQSQQLTSKRADSDQLKLRFRSQLLGWRRTRHRLTISFLGTNDSTQLLIISSKALLLRETLSIEIQVKEIHCYGQ